MSSRRTFRAIIQNAGGGGGFVEVPFDVEEAFGSKRPKIRATIEGQPYRGTLARLGGAQHILLILKSIREKAGKTFGDTVRVSLGADLKPRVVRVPPELRKELARNAAARAAFRKLSYTRRKEIARWITEARRPETRGDHVRRTMAALQHGRSPL